MARYHVNLHREMRLTFSDIEADSAEAAASIAREMPTECADEIADCDGQAFKAIVDVAGDELHQLSRTIEFEQDRLRKAVPPLLEACHTVVER